MNTKIIFSIAGVTVLIVAAILWNGNNKNEQVQTSDSSGDLVSAKGIHWHPELKITIKGEEVPIPANIGIGNAYKDHPLYGATMIGMTNMHTHDISGTLHWEVMRGPVKENDLRLGLFFSVWGKRFDNSCILDYCNGSEGAVKMFVNGEPNTEFQDYLVKDGDKIDIRYE